MPDDEGNTKGETMIGKVVKNVGNSASESLAESLSSAASGAAERATKAVTDVSLVVCQENFNRMAAERSILNTRDVRETGTTSVAMSPLIYGMVDACTLSVGVDKPGEGACWVMCAPTNQGKTHAGEFLIHGNHAFRPERSLKIDATNMTDFPKDCATTVLNCGAAAGDLAVLLCKALASTKNSASKESGLAKKATSMLGKMACEPDLTIAFDSLIEMRDADRNARR